jgi:hypothetical protein
MSNTRKQILTVVHTSLTPELLPNSELLNTKGIKNEIYKKIYLY